MRIALALVLACGCIAPPEPDPYEPSYDDGWTRPGGDPIAGCRQNSECGAQTCARDGECYPASGVRSVATTWTIDGAVASAASCAGHPDLYIRFQKLSGDSFGYAPVPCKIGKFFIDKLPTGYTRVEMGINGASRGNIATIASGAAMIDLR